MPKPLLNIAPKMRFCLLACSFNYFQADGISEKNPATPSTVKKKDPIAEKEKSQCKFSKHLML